MPRIRIDTAHVREVGRQFAAHAERLTGVCTTSQQLTENSHSSSRT